MSCDILNAHCLCCLLRTNSSVTVRAVLFTGIEICFSSFWGWVIAVLPLHGVSCGHSCSPLKLWVLRWNLILPGVQYGESHSKKSQKMFIKSLHDIFNFLIFKTILFCGYLASLVCPNILYIIKSKNLPSWNTHTEALFQGCIFVSVNDLTDVCRNSVLIFLLSHNFYLLPILWIFLVYGLHDFQFSSFP